MTLCQTAYSCFPRLPEKASFRLFQQIYGHVDDPGLGSLPARKGTQHLASRCGPLKHLAWCQLGCAHMCLGKRPAAGWGRGELSHAHWNLESQLVFLPAICFFSLSELVQGELRSCGMCWWLVPAPLSWSRTISLSLRRVGLTTSGAFTGWDWAGVLQLVSQLMLSRPRGFARAQMKSKQGNTWRATPVTQRKWRGARWDWRLWLDSLFWFLPH